MRLKTDCIPANSEDAPVAPVTQNPQAPLMSSRFSSHELRMPALQPRLHSELAGAPNTLHRRQSRSSRDAPIANV